MNLLIIPSWYPNERNEITGAFFREQALALYRQGNTVLVADATFQNRNNYLNRRMFRLRKYNDDGLKTYSYVIPSFGLPRSRTGGYEIFFRNLSRIYKTLKNDFPKIDVIHAHSFLPAGICGSRLGEISGIPVVVTEHSSSVLQRELSEGRRQLLMETVEQSDAFICVSEALKEAVIELTNTKKRIDVIPNMINQRFQYKRRDRGDSFTFISIGNLVKGKRFDLTIKAFYNAFYGNKKLRLKIIGDGVLKSELKNLAERMGINEQVIFMGRLNREQVALEIQESQAFVLPSDFETFGIVYIEALACGKPVIGTRNGGANGIINPSNGIMTDIGEEEQLTEAMVFMYQNYSSYDGRSISEACIRNYGEAAVCGRLMEIYRMVKT